MSSRCNINKITQVSFEGFIREIDITLQVSFGKFKAMKSRRNTETTFPELLDRVGLRLPRIIDNLDSKLIESKANFAALKGIMDTQTQLTERVKNLELELFISMLRKL